MFSMISIDEWLGIEVIFIVLHVYVMKCVGWKWVEKSESEWEFPSFRSSKTHLGRLRLWDHMAHLMIDRVHRSGCGPMGDLRGGGPMCSGSCLAHHLALDQWEGEDVFRKKRFWQPLFDFETFLVISRNHVKLSMMLNTYRSTNDT